VAKQGQRDDGFRGWFTTRKKGRKINPGRGARRSLGKGSYGHQDGPTRIFRREALALAFADGHHWPVEAALETAIARKRVFYLVSIAPATKENLGRWTKTGCQKNQATWSPQLKALIFSLVTTRLAGQKPRRLRFRLHSVLKEGGTDPLSFRSK